MKLQVTDDEGHVLNDVSLTPMVWRAAVDSFLHAGQLLELLDGPWWTTEARKAGLPEAELYEWEPPEPYVPPPGEDQ